MSITARVLAAAFVSTLVVGCGGRSAPPPAASSSVPPPPPAQTTPLAGGPEEALSRWQEQLESDDMQEQVEAIQGLALIGPDAAEAAPRLLEIVSQRYDTETRMQGLADAMAKLEKLEADLDAAAESEPGAESELAAWEDVDPGTFGTLDRDTGAAWALARMGDSATPAVIEALESDDPALQQGALSLIEEMGVRSAEMVPVVTELLTAPSGETRVFAARALASLEPDASECAQDLISALDSPMGDDSREKILEAMGDPEGEMAAELRVMAEVMPEAGIIARAELVSAIGEIGTDDPVIVDRLVSFVGDPMLGSAAVEALGKIGNGSAPVLAALGRAAGRESTKLAAATALARLGDSRGLDLLRRSLEAVPPRLDAAEDEMPELGQATEEELAEYIAGMFDPDEMEATTARIAALRAAGDVGQRASGLADQAAEYLGDSEPNVRREAAVALARIGNDAEAILAALRQAIASAAEADDVLWYAGALTCLGDEQPLDDALDRLTERMATQDEWFGLAPESDDPLETDYPVVDLRSWLIWVGNYGDAGAALVPDIQSLYALGLEGRFGYDEPVEVCPLIARALVD
ncbi:MAG: hypothetical protein GF320_00020, partial [Armatimonadia bacterium]|nr:hypothetical protein [Armatimonadia bacterium]